MTRLSILFLLAMTEFAIFAADMRTIAGKSVDLQPIHDWKVDMKGARPLPHWKDVLVYEILDKPGGWDKCKVNIEGKDREILVANLPAAIRSFLQTFSQRLAAIKTLRARLYTDKLAARAAADYYFDTSSGYASVTSGTSGVKVDNEDSRRARMRELSLRVEVEEKQLATLEQEHQLAVQQSSKNLTMLAMFTGRTYLKLEVWDTGLRQ